MPPEVLPTCGIGKVDLDEREFHTRERIAQGDRSMSVRARVDQKTLDARGGVLDEVEQLSFVVGLEGLQFDT